MYIPSDSTPIRESDFNFSELERRLMLNHPKLKPWVIVFNMFRTTGEFNNNDMLSSMASYHHCYVASIRDAVGLTTQYNPGDFKVEKKDRCGTCKRFAYQFYDMLGYDDDEEVEDGLEIAKRPDKYLPTLEKFVGHLEKKHKVVI